MSLRERVARAQQRQMLGDERVPEREALERLKEYLKEYMNVDEIANLSRTHKMRAENEVISMCQRIFSEHAYFVEDPREQEMLIRDVLNAFFGLGVLEEYIADEQVSEIMVNASSEVYIEREGKLSRAPIQITDEEIRRIIDRVLAPLGRRIDESSPLVDARLSAGHRLNAVIPPISPDGVYVTIRKFRAQIITLDEMVASHSLDGASRALLAACVKARLNIAVYGGTGSGKTTLLNALSNVISPDERIITIEDSAELRFDRHPHVVRLEARPPNAEGRGYISIRDLVKNALRMRPDRIIVGECRGAEALDMLQAMNTGHDGSLTTLHANSAEDALMRLIVMVSFESSLPLEAIHQQIAGALDLTVEICRAAGGERYISNIALVEFDASMRRCLTRDIYRRTSFEEAGQIAFDNLGKLRELLDASRFQKEVDYLWSLPEFSSS